MTNWQPIETAPKYEDPETGKDIWILLTRAHEQSCFLAAFYTPDGYAGGPGWETLDGCYHPDWPTHWMPIPEPLND